MKSVVLFLLLSFSLGLSAQRNLALINDPDGYTFVRNGPSIDSAIIDTIYSYDLFYTKGRIGDWYELNYWGGQNLYMPLYMHMSRVRLFDDLSKSRKVEVYQNVFNKVLKIDSIRKYKYNNGFDFQRESWKTVEDSLQYYNIMEEFYTSGMADVGPIQFSFNEYICANKDFETLSLYVKVCLAYQRAENELISVHTAKCFTCYPDFVCQEMTNNQEFYGIGNILSQIEWGLLNLYATDPMEEPNSSDYLKYKKRLEKFEKSLL